MKSLVAIYPFYIRFSLIGGSILLWTYVIQVVSGILVGYVYSWVFDSGLPGVLYFWWETYWGSFLSRIHSEFGNLVFFMLYVHIIIKIWVTAFHAELEHTWLSGIIIFFFSYIAGITGAIMPCSILSEVTATVIGYAINSLTFIKFDFLETLMIPGLGLTDETVIRVFIIHALFPILALLVVVDHLNNLHATEYTDDDEMEVLFFYRLEYWHEFIWLEVGFWFEILILFLSLRFLGDFFNLPSMVVSYSLTNFEYWPLTEEIDFVLAIPHWYLRPLMASLVVIPHHYLGFFYIIFFFILLALFPWTMDFKSFLFSETYQEFLTVSLPNDLNIFSSFFILLLIMVFVFSTLIIPTGRYFVSAGSSEFLVFTYWLIFSSFIIFIRFAYYVFNSVYFFLYVTNYFWCMYYYWLLSITLKKWKWLIFWIFNSWVLSCLRIISRYVFLNKEKKSFFRNAWNLYSKFLCSACNWGSSIHRNLFLRSSWRNIVRGVVNITFILYPWNFMQAFNTILF